MSNPSADKKKQGTPYLFNIATEKWTQISEDVANLKCNKKRVCWVKPGEAPPYLSNKHCNSPCVVTFNDTRERANDALMQIYYDGCADMEPYKSSNVLKLLYHTEMIVPVKCKKDSGEKYSDEAEKKKQLKYRLIYLRHIKSPITENSILQDVFVKVDGFAKDDKGAKIATPKPQYGADADAQYYQRSQYDFHPKDNKMYDPVSGESMELCCEQDPLDYYETVLLGYYLKDPADRSAYRNKFFKPPKCAKAGMSGKKCYDLDFLCGEWLGSSEVDRQKACLNRQYGIRITM
jgi:hypothetical protein